MGYENIPLAFLMMRLSVASRKVAVAVEERKAVAHHVPFGMPAAAILQVARESAMSYLSESLAYGLALLASHKYVQLFVHIAYS